MTPCLLFNTEALEAAEFYAGIFPSSTIAHVNRYGEGGPVPEGTVLTVNFTLDGQDYMALNCGQPVASGTGVSFMVHCASQDEVDHLWAGLTEGGSPGQCGWLTDRYGISWQIIPSAMGAYLGDPDPARAARAMRAMMTMTKLDLALFEAAVNAEQ